MNREIEVAFCNKRTDLRYTNRKMLWSEFVRMLQANKVTLETHAEYMKMTKDRQGEIKDVGGFVSGYLRNGSRKINDVIRKYFITLDIDDKASQQILKISVLSRPLKPSYMELINTLKRHLDAE